MLTSSSSMEAADAAASNNTSSDASQLHVTSQTLTLGRRDNDDNHDYYFSVDHEEIHHHHGNDDSRRGTQETECVWNANNGVRLPLSKSWWKRLSHPFQSTIPTVTDHTASNSSTAVSENDAEAGRVSTSVAPEAYRSLNEGTEHQRSNTDKVTEGRGGSRQVLGPSLPQKRRYRRGVLTTMVDQHDNMTSIPQTPLLHTSGESVSKSPPERSSLNASVEEELTRGSFFFRDSSSDSFPQRRKSTTTSFRSSFQTLLRDSTHQEFAYRDASAIHVALAPPVLSHYRTQYDLLNQPLERSDAYGGDNYYDDDDLSEDEGNAYFYHRHRNRATHYDLELQVGDEVEEDGGGSSDTPIPTSSPTATSSSTTRTTISAPTRKTRRSKVTRTDSATLSSLLYRDRGRILLKLPSDHVRLVMDPDLRPGILSVEQWRKPNPANDNDNNKDNRDNDDTVERPPLHYVLTVPDNLYRQIVGELSDAVTNPYCGMSKCCSEKEFVDIRVAMAIIGTVLIILLLLTFVWPVS